MADEPDNDNDNDDERDDDAQPSAAFDALAVFDALHRLSLAHLQSAPTSPTASAWRDLANAAAVAIGGEPAAEAIPVPGRPAMVYPPARGGAIAVTSRPPMAVPPRSRGPQGIGAATPVPTIKDRPDVAAELERVKRGGRKP